MFSHLWYCHKTTTTYVYLLLLLFSFIYLADIALFTNTAHKTRMNWNYWKVISSMFWKNAMTAGMWGHRREPVASAHFQEIMLRGCKIVHCHWCMSSRETKASMSIHIYIQTYLQRYTNRNVIVCCYTNYIIAKIYLNYRKAKQIGMELLILLFAALLTVPNVYYFFFSYFCSPTWQCLSAELNKCNTFRCYYH